MDLDNPFANFGSIVEGDRFIGRINELREIDSRIILPSESGNLAIIGLPRIGKSSLAHKALIEKKNDLVQKKIIPIWINLSTFENSNDFFVGLVHECMHEFKELNIIKSSIYNAYEDFKRESVNKIIYDNIRRFFQKVRKEGFRIVLIIDEFDHAKRIFRENIGSFQKLRDLADNPNWRVIFVLISRRTIRDIEFQSAGVSNFDGIFHKIFLSMFNEQDMDEYFKMINNTGLNLGDSEKEKIYFYCGGYPYLLAALAFSLIENWRKTSITDIDKVANYTFRTMIEHYERLVYLLKEDGSLDKILQLLFDPLYNVKRTDIEELKRYGLIYERDNGYKTFSNHFQIFLNLIYREIDLWPLYRETEKSLRKVIEKEMIAKYGDNWIEIVLKKHQKLKDAFNKAEETMEKEKKYYGDRASTNILDYTYFMDLFALIFSEWEVFKDIFGKDKNYWEERAKMLTKIRNVMAHCRDENLYEDNKIIAEGYCKEILRILNK